MEDKTLEFDKEKFDELIKHDEFEEFKAEYFPDTKITEETMEELSNGKGDDENVEQPTSELHEDFSE